MASPGNPLMGGGGSDPSAQSAGAGMLPTVLGALASKSQGGGDDPSQQLSQQMSANQGADPSMVLQQLNQINQLLGVLFVKTFQSMPNLANQISATMKALSRALKEGGQAANVGEAVWDGRAVMEGLDPNWIGYYFDPCHATAEANCQRTNSPCSLPGTKEYSELSIRKLTSRWRK